MRWKVRKIIGRVVSGTPIMELRIDGITNRAKPTQGLSLPSLFFYTPYSAKLKKSLWCRYDFFSSCVMSYIYI